MTVLMARIVLSCLAYQFMRIMCSVRAASTTCIYAFVVQSKLEGKPGIKTICVVDGVIFQVF